MAAEKETAETFAQACLINPSCLHSGFLEGAREARAKF
jgi:hypothetical protein